MKGTAGFTLIEWVVAMALVSLLVGVVTPGFVAQLNHARTRSAQSDVTTIGTALAAFHEDVGTWPTRDSSGRDNRMAVLLSGIRVPRRDPFRGGGFWALTRGGSADTLDNHLYHNTPKNSGSAAYATNTFSAWHGPYAEPAGLDPWGRPYVVNVGAGHSSHSRDHRRLWVLSAGPDGRFQTSARARLGDRARGDDIGFLVFVR